MLFCVNCGSPSIGRICQNCLRQKKLGAGMKPVEDKKKPCSKPLLTGSDDRATQFRALGISE